MSDKIDADLATILAKGGLEALEAFERGDQRQYQAFMNLGDRQKTVAKSRNAIEAAAKAQLARVTEAGHKAVAALERGDLNMCLRFVKHHEAFKSGRFFVG